MMVVWNVVISGYRVSKEFIDVASCERYKGYGFRVFFYVFLEHVPVYARRGDGCVRVELFKVGVVCGDPFVTFSVDAVKEFKVFAKFFVRCEFFLSFFLDNPLTVFKTFKELV